MDVDASEPQIGAANTVVPQALDDLIDAADADLLQYISWKKEYSELARRAFEVFHARHAEFIYRVCVKRYGGRLPHYYATKDLAGDALLRAVDAAGTYKGVPGLGQEAARRQCRAWLLVVIHSVVMDVYRGKPTNENSRTLEWFEDLAEAPMADSPRLRLAEQAIKEVLSEREAEVLRVTLYYRKDGAEHQRLPNDIAAEIAATLDTSTENLRKIRASALAKVRAFIERAEASAKEQDPTHAQSKK